MRQLNRAALSIITSIQALRTFAIDDMYVNPNENVGGWLHRCEMYYTSIPDTFMAQSGLVKNDYDFRLVLDYVVTEEMMATEHKDLGIFFLDRDNRARRNPTNQSAGSQSIPKNNSKVLGTRIAQHVWDLGEKVLELSREQLAAQIAKTIDEHVD